MFWGGRGRSRGCGWGERSAFVYTGLDAFLSCEADWLDPPSDAEMERLAELFGGEMPDPVRWLYERTGGCFQNPKLRNELLPSRLLTIDEVAEAFEQTPSLIGRPVWLFADGLGDRVGVYSSDICRGLATAWEHETLDFSPRWKDINAFLEAMMRAESAYGVACVTAEFPASIEDTGPEAQLAAEFLGRAERSSDAAVRADLLRFAARLMTSELARRMLPFVSSGDQQCAEIAATELARWRVAEAVPVVAKACREHDSHLLLDALRTFRIAKSQAIVDAIYAESKESYKRATRGGSA